MPLTTARPMNLVGIEYGNTSAGGAFDPAWFVGVRRVKLTDVTWGQLQPAQQPGWCSFWPSGPFCASAFSWAKLDAEIAAWRAAGFTEVGVVLRTKHDDPAFTAATISSPPELGPYAALASKPPRSLSMWRAFVRKFCERYVASGLVSWVEFESEQQSPMFWLGTAADYIAALEVVSQEVRRASSTCLVVLGGHNFGDALDDDPSYAQWEARIRTLSEPWQGLVWSGLDFLRATFKRTDLFDVVEFHNLSAPSGIKPAYRRTRELLVECAPSTGAAKHLWIGDATSSPAILPDARAFLPPASDKEMWDRFWRLLGGDASAIAQLRSDQARTTQAKIQAARELAAPITFYSLTDYPPLSFFPFNGLVDPDGTRRLALGVILAAAP